MTVLIVMGYIAWIVVTLFICYAIIGLASFATMDTQNYGVWAFAITLVLGVVALSVTGLVLLS